MIRIMSSREFQKLNFYSGVNVITIPKRLIADGDLLIVERKSFEKIARENAELRAAMKAVLIGEQELYQKKTRSMKDFLQSKFPEYAKNY